MGRKEWGKAIMWSSNAAARRILPAGAAFFLALGGLGISDAGNMGIITAFADSGEEAVSGAFEESGLPSVIQYTDLESLVKAYSPQVQMERIQYDSRLARYEDARDQIMETRRLLREEADDMDKNGDSAGASHYRAQAKQLKEAADSMDEQIRHAKGSSSTMSLRKMEDTMVRTAQRLMGTYHSLKLEQEASAALAQLKQSQYEKLLNQVALGSVSQAQAEEAGKAASAAANHAEAARSEMTRTRKELLLITGYGPDSQVEIGLMPEPQASRVDGMGWDSDKWKALGNNYTLREQRGSGGGRTNKELHAHQREVNQGEQDMYGQMDTLYQQVLSTYTAWNGAVTAMGAQEAAFSAANHKMELGMLARQDYLEARSAYLEAVAAKGQADVDFQQAMDAYDWAVKGLTDGV